MKTILFCLSILSALFLFIHIISGLIVDLNSFKAEGLVQIALKITVLLGLLAIAYTTRKP